MPNSIDTYAQQESAGFRELATVADQFRARAEALGAVQRPSDGSIIADFEALAMAGNPVQLLHLTKPFGAIDNNGVSGFEKAIDAMLAKHGSRFDPQKVADLGAALADYRQQAAAVTAALLQAVEDVLPPGVVL